MSGPITARSLLINKNFVWYQSEIVRVLKRVRVVITHAKNSTRLNGKTLDEIMKPSRDLLATHVANKNNPHGETLQSINTYSDAYIRSILSGKVPQGILPISTYGISDGLTDAEMLASWTVSGFTIGIARELSVIVSGTLYTLPAWSIDVRTIAAIGTGRTYHVYLYLKFGQVTYQCREDIVPEGTSMMYVGSVVAGPTGITSRTFATVIRIDTFRISMTPVGSAIPVTSGTYDAITKFPSPWNPI